MVASFNPVCVAIGDLVPHPTNVRSKSTEIYEPDNIVQLMASVALLGLVQPLLVQKIEISTPFSRAIAATLP